MLSNELIIITSTLGGVCALLIICVIVLSVFVFKLWKKSFRSDKEIQKNYAYQNPSIQRNEELGKRGFSMHDGSSIPRPNSAAPYRGEPNRDGRASPPGVFGSEPNRNRNMYPNDRNISKDAKKEFGDYDNMVFGGDNNGPRANKSQLFGSDQNNGPRPSHGGNFRVGNMSQNNNSNNNQNNNRNPNYNNNSSYNDNMPYGNDQYPGSSVPINRNEDKTYFNSRAMNY